MRVAGDDSSNEDQGEERAGDGETKEAGGNKIKKETAAEEDGASEGPAAETGEQNDEGEEEHGEEEEDGKETKSEDGEEFSFPDTTISLSHLQPSR